MKRVNINVDPHTKVLVVCEVLGKSTKAEVELRIKDSIGRFDLEAAKADGFVTSSPERIIGRIGWHFSKKHCDFVCDTWAFCHARDLKIWRSKSF